MWLLLLAVYPVYAVIVVAGGSSHATDGDNISSNSNDNSKNNHNDSNNHNNSGCEAFIIIVKL